MNGITLIGISGGGGERAAHYFIYIFISFTTSKVINFLFGSLT